MSGAWSWGGEGVPGVGAFFFLIQHVQISRGHKIMNQIKNISVFCMW